MSLGGLIATGQAVVAASQYSSGFSLDEFPPDGLLGMGFISISETGRAPVFQNLILQGQTTEPVFGFTLLDNGGELVLGGTDTNAFSGSLTIAPLLVTNPPAFWEISVTSVNVGNRHAVTAAHDAILDTGTTLLIVDPQSALQIYEQIPGAEDASSVLGPGFFVVPCDDVPNNVGFTIAGTTFTLSADTFNFGELEEGSNACVGGVVGDNEGETVLFKPSLHLSNPIIVDFWILGDVFMRNLYTRPYLPLPLSDADYKSRLIPQNLISPTYRLA